MPVSPPRVVAVINSFHRAPVLRRLLDSLTGIPELGGVILVASPDDPATASLARERPIIHRCLAHLHGGSLGAGYAAGLRAGLAEPATTHFLLVDDDAELLPTTLANLLAAMEQEQAAAGMPLLVDAAGHVRWFPGLADRRKFRLLRGPALTPEEFIRRCGAEPAPFTWAPGPMLLVARWAVERFGAPRSDFCFMGDDLEYSLRLSSAAPAIWVPRAVGRHLPPGTKRGAEAYYIDCMHLQNVCYIAARLPHGARLRRNVPGAAWRFLRSGHFRARRIADMVRAVWQGAVHGRPAGADGGDRFWHAFKRVRAQ
ncbi:MAG TPA: glycosyltransferase [Opitutaceae bacterium]|nr:glycosyltransferase [Opitutaceae bacterium]